MPVRFLNNEELSERCFFVRDRSLESFTQSRQAAEKNGLNILRVDLYYFQHE
jgi:hypothetical protein